MAAVALDPAISRYEARLDRSDPARVAAWERFVELGGFPGPRDESWRQTPVKGIVQGVFAEPSQALEQGLTEKPAAGAALQRFESVAGLVAIAPADHPFVALNAAFLTGGLSVVISPGAVLSEPVMLTEFQRPPGEYHTRVVIEVGEGARVSFVEGHAADATAPTFSTHVTEILVGDGAHVEYTVWQQFGDKAHHVAVTQAELGRDSRITFNGFTDGGALVRNEVRARFAQPGGESHMNGVFLARGSEHVDYHTQVDHAATDTTSRQCYKGVLADRARGVFEGHVIIRPGAQRTNAEQSNHNLLLTDGAGVHTKPLLEIHNDDVKCAHGAAIGQLDDAALFYLRARGVPVAQARRMLIEAFVDDVVNRIGDATVRAWLAPRVRAALPLGGPA